MSAPDAGRWRRPRWHEDHVENASTVVIRLRELAIVDQIPHEISDVIEAVIRWWRRRGDDRGATNGHALESILPELTKIRRRKDCVDSIDDVAGGWPGGSPPLGSPEDQTVRRRHAV